MAVGSMVLNDGGRYYEGGDWLRMMYGAFSGPTLGPAGSAICAYDAENTDSDTTVPGVFQNDLILAVEGAKDTRQRNFWFNVSTVPDTTNGCKLYSCANCFSWL